MAITSGSQYRFRFGTAAEYASATVNANDLYFLTDTKQIYVGTDLYTGSVSFVNEFPASPSQGVIYCNPTTHETKVWNGTAWQVMVPAVESSITAGSTSTNLADIGAIKSYVAAEIAKVPEAVEDVAYDASTANLTISYTGSTTDKVINLPKENFLSAASYDADTHILTLTLVDETEVTVDLGDLIDVYTVADTTTVDMTLSGNEISAAVKVSATAGNALTTEADGLYVATVDPLVKSIDDTTSIDLTVDSAGKLTAAAKISSAAGNKLTTDANGLVVAADFIGSVDDTTTIDLDVTGAELTAAVKVSNTANNQLTTDAAGLYVAPATWTTIAQEIR